MQSGVRILPTSDNRWICLSDQCYGFIFQEKIIAWTLLETLEVSCVIDTINKAKARRNIDQLIIIHSDRGSHACKGIAKVTENMQRKDSEESFSVG